MPFQIIRNDITKVKADAIVNTANPEPAYGKGTDQAIYEAAGAEQLLAERKKIGKIGRGFAAVTPAFNLKAKYIIHTVGPVWHGGNKGELDILRGCYENSLELAKKLNCKSIAFPLIAAGTYGFPKDKALDVATSAISGFLLRDDVEMKVTLVVYDSKAFQLSENLFEIVQSFISDGEVRTAKEFGLNSARYYEPEAVEPGTVYDEIDVDGDYDADHEDNEPSFASYGQEKSVRSFVKQKKKTNYYFRDRLMDYLIEKDIKNSTAYKMANIDKSAFSKILSGDTKIPKRDSVMGLCLSLNLTIDESKDLMASAGYAFNPYDGRENFVMRCIEKGPRNIFIVNTLLAELEYDSLGK